MHLFPFFPTRHAREVGHPGAARCSNPSRPSPVRHSRPPSSFPLPSPSFPRRREPRGGATPSFPSPLRHPLMPFPRPSSPSRSSPTPIVVPASLSVVPAEAGTQGRGDAARPPHALPPSVIPDPHRRSRFPLRRSRFPLRRSLPQSVVPAEAGTQGRRRHARAAVPSCPCRSPPPFRHCEGTVAICTPLSSLRGNRSNLHPPFVIPAQSVPPSFPLALSVVPAQAGTQGRGGAIQRPSFPLTLPPFRHPRGNRSNLAGRGEFLPSTHTADPPPSCPSPSVVPSPSPSFPRRREPRGGASCPWRLSPTPIGERASRRGGPVGPRLHGSDVGAPRQAEAHKICSYKSDHQGFPSSINLTFHARFHFFSAFSLLMALSIES